MSLVLLKTFFGGHMKKIVLLVLLNQILSFSGYCADQVVIGEFASMQWSLPGAPLPNDFDKEQVQKSAIEKCVELNGGKIIPISEIKANKYSTVGIDYLIYYGVYFCTNK